MIIEFIGLPCSGKSYCYLKLKQSLKIETFSYIDIFYIYSKKILYLNPLQSIYFELSYKIYKKNIKNIKFYNTNKKIKNNFNILSNLKNEIRDILQINENQIKKNLLNQLNYKEKKLLKILYSCVKKTPINLDEKKILKDRVEKEFIAGILIKKLNLYKLNIINEEGFYQRILTAYKNKKEIFKYIDVFKKFLKINYIILKKTSLHNIIIRSKKRKNGFKYKNISSKEIEIWQKIFDNIKLKEKLNILKNPTIKKIKNLIKSKNLY